MASVALIFLFGLFESAPKGFPDEHFIRIMDEADLPDFTRTRAIPSLPGYRGGLFREAKFGNRPGKCDVVGRSAVERAKKTLGEPLRIVRLGNKVYDAYVWRWHENPHKGMLIVINEQPPSLHLRGWSFLDRARNGRVGTVIEGQIYRWFDELVGR